MAARRMSQQSCTMDDCDSPILARGWCNKHWQRWYRTGDPLGKWHRTTPCAVTDCTRPAKARGWCGAHWNRWDKYGDPLGVAILRTAADRFWEKVEVRIGACWLWIGSCATNGYGRFWSDSARQIPAHVWIYELMFGPVPTGLEIDHVHAWGCRHRNCVRPTHLEAVTHVENLRRRVRKTRELKLEEVA